MRRIYTLEINLKGRDIGEEQKIQVEEYGVRMLRWVGRIAECEMKTRTERESNTNKVGVHMEELQELEENTHEQNFKEKVSNLW